MKKILIAIILAAMFGWAVYDFVSTDESPEDSGFQATDQTETKDAGEGAEAQTGLDIGNQAPDFTLQRLNGEEIELSELRGQRVMLNFWATWCPPCRAEMPDMEEFYQNENVVVLAVNLTETESSRQGVEDFVEEYGLSFPVLLDEDTVVANAYAIQPVPTTYMIDSNGVIQYKAFGAMNYDMMVREFEKME
ncbi:redoxin domain-containing protein [Virgibacillus xinjiangensis]|uniref:Redoxin domain-containing protein n=1 Tax=Virgibacillus xinjiangensis TaxID=393090 RepID=A0ABV7CTG4_9BACI